MFLTKIYNYGRLLNENVKQVHFLSPKIASIGRPFHLNHTLKREVEEKFTNEESVRYVSKDKSSVIPVETSIRYIESKAYAETYGTDPVWKVYRRNHKGARAPRKTRATCIRGGKIATGNPCPICRDDYLVLNSENTKLIEQFISPHTGEILSYSVTGICQKKHKELLVAIKIAKDKGLIKFDVPFRVYDYSLYKNLIGGGIAGVSCLEGLSFLAPEESIILISSSPVIKKVSNLKHLTKLLSEFKVEEKSSEILAETCSSLSVLHSTVTSIDYNNKLVFTTKETVRYEKLCICSGASPKLIDASSPFVIGIRDTDSVEEFRKRIESSKKMVVVGNGGIATELVHEVSEMEIIWVIKDNHISATFIDPGAAEFFQSSLVNNETSTDALTKRMKFTVEKGGSTSLKGGAALGPDWHSKVDLRGMLQSKSSVTIEYCSEVKRILNKNEGMALINEDWPVFVELTNGKVYGCDFIVSATGVVPNTSFLPDTGGITLSSDGGIAVNWKMETSVADVYAAGDVCTVSWEPAPQWCQMRLWTQARQMGTYAAKAMVMSLRGEELLQDFCFELFTHVTKFFGFKVILLGLFNGQRLDSNYEILLRVTKGTEYVKLVLKEGRMQGAVLIGDTDLEEMCENLILNQLDLSPFGEELLNPDIDIDDYFD